MKTITRGPYTLSVCAAAAMLAGCGGSAQLPNPAAQTSLGDATPQRVGSASSAESLIGRVDITECVSFDVEICHFKVNGKRIARGPYPGTFTARGNWESELSSYPFCLGGCWSFSERFTITSGATKISGSISASGTGATFMPIPGVYQYTTTNGYSGNVEISAFLPHFGEAFYGM
jgi:hypothetical protein